MGHYEAYDWEELLELPAGGAYVTLGWNKVSWTSGKHFGSGSF